MTSNADLEDGTTESGVEAAFDPAVEPATDPAVEPGPGPAVEPATPVRPAAVRQRAALVLPTTGEFDSRTYRIASALVARGHDVVVLARWRPGLPEEERHPAGYAIRRVKVSAGAGLPLPGPLYRLISTWRLRRRERAARQLRSGSTTTIARTPATTAAEAAPPTTTAAPPSGTSAESAPPTSAEWAPPTAVRPAAPPKPPPPPDNEEARPAGAAARGPLARIARLPSALWRIAAIGLVVRSQSKATRRLGETADLYHAMAYMGIPVALDLVRRTGGRTVYDARDIYMEAGNLARLPRPARAIFGRMERRWARRADRVITVNRPYAEVMERRFGTPLPLIVLNCSYRFDPPVPPERRFHDALGLASGTRVVLYQGGLSRDRGIEQLIAAIPSVDRAVLVLLGYGALQAELAAIAAQPATVGRVRLLPAVPPGELLDWVACADIVAMPIQPTTLNHRLTTPNKLFEAMAAGAAVVASDLPGMAGIVRETGCGLLVDPTDPGAIADAIRSILDAPDGERLAYGARALAAAHTTYNWERQMDVLLDEYARLTGNAW